jgi:hypothetical protein
VSASRRALRAWLVAVPVFLACSAVPSGGLGRERGYVDIDLYGRYAEGLLNGHIPYRDVFVEYPPGAFVVLVPPAIVTDEHYRFAFKALMALIALGGLWCVARLLVELGAGPRRLALALGFLAVSPLMLGSVWLNSYDAWPAVLSVAALLALVFGFVAVAFACLGLAFAAKVYAAVLVVPAALYAASRWGVRAVVKGSLAFMVAAAVVVVPFASASPDGVWSSIRSQAERGLHIESLGASLLLAGDRLGLYDATVTTGSTAAKSRDLAGVAPDTIAAITTILLAIAIVAVWIAFARSPRDAQRLTAAFAAGVAAVLAFSKVLSPQYGEWLLFLCPLAAGAGGIAAAALAAIAFVLVNLWFHHYSHLYEVDSVVWLVLLRNAAFVACYGVLLAALSASPRRSGGSVSTE